MKKTIECIIYLVLFINLILINIACINSYKTIEYMKYSDYVLNDWLLQQESNYRGETVENSVEK